MKQKERGMVALDRKTTLRAKGARRMGHPQVHSDWGVTNGADMPGSIELRKMRVLVVGLARTGVATALFARGTMQW